MSYTFSELREGENVDFGSGVSWMFGFGTAYYVYY